HLRGDEEGTEGYKAGDVLPGDGPINDALAELKQPGSVLARQKAEAAKKPAATRAADKPADAKSAERPAAAPATPAPAKPDAPASTVPIKP
ncbi:MAG: peptidase S41, partial [Stenotrophomonas maltophilia]